MGVSGLPQSATGQASLLCGLNAARLIGRHVEGFPGPALREVIREHNMFVRLRGRGYACTFANAYYLDDIDELDERFHSVTTVSTLAAFGGVRGKKYLHDNKAVYHDLTRHSLFRRGYEGPLIDPAEAGRHLVRIAEEHDVTLFEYFQTDVTAHKGSPTQIQEVLCNLDAFLSAAARFAEKEGHGLILTSDHGNIEDLRTRKHTNNPVPLMVLENNHKTAWPEVRSLPDVLPALLKKLPPPEHS